MMQTLEQINENLQRLCDLLENIALALDGDSFFELSKKYEVIAGKLREMGRPDGSDDAPKGD